MTFIFILDDGEYFNSVYSVISDDVSKASELFLKSLPLDSIERKYCGVLESPEPNHFENFENQYWLGSWQIFEIKNAVTKLI